MGKLMANDQADSAKVHRIVHGAIEERRLQDSSRKDDFVAIAAIISVDGRGRHAPIAPIDRATNVTPLPQIFKFAGAYEVVDHIARDNLEIGIVAPLVGKSDFVTNGLQLDMRLLLGGFRDPWKIGNVLAQH